jgi:hypothetical protein
VGLRACLDAVEMSKTLLPPEIKSQPSSPLSKLPRRTVEVTSKHSITHHYVECLSSSSGRTGQEAHSIRELIWKVMVLLYESDSLPYSSQSLKLTRLFIIHNML